jgi:type II secretory ATPase GspE/PulE/Tfp pilus assembly ATPase PilB-like protein
LENLTLHTELSKDETLTKGKEKGSRVSETESEEIDEKKIVEEAPIIKVVAVILRHAVEGTASDIERTRPYANDRESS